MNITQTFLYSQVFNVIKLTFNPEFLIIHISITGNEVLTAMQNNSTSVSNKNRAQNKSQEKTIFIFDAEEGMVLSRDVIKSDGSLIAARGTTLDMDIIAKISGYHILEINIVDIPPAPKAPAADTSTYFEKIRGSEQFKAFRSEYTTGVSDLKNQLNDIVNRNSNVDEESLLIYPLSLMSKYSNSLQMFDMLHCLRQFDDLTYAHSINVALVASIIGQWLGCSEDDIRILTLCGLLHDIGKMRVPEEILNKPGKLTAAEFDVMKKHVNFGYDIIKDKNIDARIKEACLLHHEKCNGTGYPFGLTRDRIPDFAKIISIADIYDAMTSDRVYRGAVCPFTVIHLMEQECFTTLDPAFALPFLKNVVSSYIHTNVKLSDGEVGEVILINDKNLSCPVVKCGGEFLDLSKRPDLNITAIL